MHRRDFLSAVTMALRARSAAAQKKTLKQRVHARETIRIAPVPLNATAAEVKRIIQKQPVDLAYANGQHTPLVERELFDFCTAAEAAGVGVQLRIKHARQCYLVGNYADLGPMSMKIPSIEEEQHVREAIDSFYFPPLGRRSWPGLDGFRIKSRPDRLEYAAWWNANAILCLQVESLRGVLNIRRLVQPGVDWIHFGPEDLNFDLEMHSNSPFKNHPECVQYVAEQLRNVDVCVADRAENSEGILIYKSQTKV